MSFSIHATVPSGRNSESMRAVPTPSITDESRSPFDELCDSIRLPQKAKRSFKQDVLLAFFLRLVGVGGADVVEESEPYLQARFDDRAACVFERMEPETVFNLLCSVVSAHALLSHRAPFPRALEAVSAKKRLAAIIMLLMYYRNEGLSAHLRTCAAIVAREGGQAHISTIDGLVAWSASQQRCHNTVHVSF